MNYFAAVIFLPRFHLSRSSMNKKSETSEGAWDHKKVSNLPGRVLQSVSSPMRYSNAHGKSIIENGQPGREERRKERSREGETAREGDRKGAKEKSSARNNEIDTFFKWARGGEAGEGEVVDAWNGGKLCLKSCHCRRCNSARVKWGACPARRGRRRKRVGESGREARWALRAANA